MGVDQDNAGPAGWDARVLTLFPEIFPGILAHSLAGKALRHGLWCLNAIDVRSFATNRHATVDDTPFGGGAGMVIKPDVVDAAVRATGPHHHLVFVTPRGHPLTQDRVKKWAAGPGLTILCGRYEGVDQRVLDAHNVDEVSIGDYVLSGGELAALVILDTCIRLLPGVMGNQATSDEESFEGGLLEYPHYTRPAQWTDGNGVLRPVPDVLMSGHHERIREWRRHEAEEITRLRRPDLWDRYQRGNNGGDGKHPRKG